MRYRNFILCLFLLINIFYLRAQDQYELNSGWKCINKEKIKISGDKISLSSYQTKGWMNATVPGTVLTTLINNKIFPDPFYGMNNELIPDIYKTGKNFYTYWFVKDFKEIFPKDDQQIWLHFRGINYSCEVYLNGHKLNDKIFKGMFLRQQYNITPFLAKDGNNRLAVIVYPPDVVGNPNGGQGGDGEIARNVSHQYVAGWDWIQPIRDRNTGIWDKVIIEKTGAVNISNAHIITLVSGARLPNAKMQEAATIKASAEVENISSENINGNLKYNLNGDTISVAVHLQPHSKTEIKLPDYLLQNPKLWWPNGYGEQNLYHITFIFENDFKKISDKENIDFGVREISTTWNTTTRSRQAFINGQPIFIKGGNWIVSDELLRFTDERYDAEVRFHRDMNLNLIRVWGGALLERPEFYNACDKYGLLVFQDFWNSGDCNGRWLDPQKKESQWTRRNYPDDHELFLNSVSDQVKMIRNHPSLAFWCGGNEITPPADILSSMKDSLMPSLDGTRYFFDYSNSDSMSYNFLGGNGDGPYGVQPLKTFWAEKTFPFNSEIGSVGVGDYESLERFMPKENLTVPVYHSKEDSIWRYHKYIGYDSTVYKYGVIKDLKDFTLKAQLVNYDQYRALMEGFGSHMWEWYTGSIIWKTQNPWTALRGQMYDYYLDVNACLYGLHNGSEPLHVMFDPIENMIMIVNNTFSFHRDMMLEVKAYNKDGKEKILTQVYEEIGPSTVRKYIDMTNAINKLRKEEGTFLLLRLLDNNRQAISENFYWLPDAQGNYTGLQQMKKAFINISAKKINDEKISVTINNPQENTVAFFNRISLIDAQTHKRILPAFFSDNYISVVPGMSKTIIIDYKSLSKEIKPMVSVKGWNVDETTVSPQ